MNLNPAVRRCLTVAAMLLPFVAAFAAYYPGLHGGFLFDDYASIVNNQALTLPSLAWHNLAAAALSAPTGPLDRPLSVLSFALDRYFFGPGPLSFKLTNLLIHLAAGAVLLLLTRELLLAWRRIRPQVPAQDGLFAALAVTAAWLLHPLNLTAVLYVVQREASLAALFTALGVLCYTLGRNRELDGKRGWPLIWIAAPLAGLVGLFCKETAVLLPLFLCAVELTLFRFRNGAGRVARPLLVYFILGLGGPALIAGWLLVFHPAFLLGGYVIRPFTLGERLLTEGRVVTLYILYTLWPLPHWLGLYHDDLAVSTGLLTPPTTLIAFLFLAALLAAAVWLRRRQPLVTLGILWFFAGQVLESSFIPLDLMYEHRAYLSDYGLLLALAAGLLLWKPAWLRFSRRTLAITAIVVLGCLTWLRSVQWSNDLSQALFEAKYHPASPRATFALAFEYALAAEHGDRSAYPLALEHFQQAAKLQPQALAPYVAMIELASGLHQPVHPAWMRELRQRAGRTLMPPLDLVYLGYWVQCARSTCGIPAAATLPVLERALDNPHVPKSGCMRGNLLGLYAEVLGDARQIGPAFQALQSAVRLCPQQPQLRINLINSYLNAGALAAARDELRQLEARNRFGQLDNPIAKLRLRLRTMKTAAPALRGKPAPPVTRRGRRT